MMLPAVELHKLVSMTIQYILATSSNLQREVCIFLWDELFWKVSINLFLVLSCPSISSMFIYTIYIQLYS